MLNLQLKKFYSSGPRIAKHLMSF